MSVRRALVCAPTMPEYDREGGSRRVFHLIEFLRQDGWAVSFVALNASDGERYARPLRQRGVAPYAGINSWFVGDEYLPDIRRLIEVGRFDLAILAFWHLAEFYLPTIRRFSPGTRILVDSIDLHFLRSARRILRKPDHQHTTGTLDLDYGAEMIREMNTYAAADGVLAVSQKEADLINDMVADPGLAFSVPLMEDLPPSALSFQERQGVLFIGNFRHPPNVEATKHLLEDILPLVAQAVLAEHPVYIVGNALSQTVRDYASGMRHVRVAGWVPSVLPYLQRARISVIPLLHGAGTKTKLIQALTVGTPTVSTSIGIEGLNLRDGEHVMVADNPAAFAASMAKLLDDSDLWQRLATQGRVHITAAHGREAVRARFMSVVSRVLARDVKRVESVEIEAAK